MRNFKIFPESDDQKFLFAYCVLFGGKCLVIHASACARSRCFPRALAAVLQSLPWPSIACAYHLTLSDCTAQSTSVLVDSMVSEPK